MPARGAPPPPGQPLVLMVLDVIEESRGQFHIWGTTPEGASVLVRVADFEPHFHIAAPAVQVSRLPRHPVGRANRATGQQKH